MSTFPPCPHCGSPSKATVPGQDEKFTCTKCGKTFIMGTGPVNAVNLREGASEVKEL